MSLTMAREAQQAGALPAFERAEARLERLREIIRTESYQEGEFKLSSGGTSSYFFQLRQTTMHGEGASLIGDLIVEFMRRESLRCIGGLELGAVPVVSAAAVAGFRGSYPLAAFFVRKARKQHGARERIDGHIERGGEVLAVDDVTTTGGSVLEAIEAIADTECRVTKALSIVDREEGAAENLAAKGIALYSLFSRSDFKSG